MKSQEIELWARDIVDSVLNRQTVEDSRIELKAKWIESEKAAPRLGGHANAARGENILWLIGVDERNNSLTNIDAKEKGDWYKKVEKCFDGFAPRLLDDVNFKVNGKAIVALYFDTSTESPYVVKNPKGGFPEYIVPWREGTDLRAARRENLLKLLVPNRRMSLLLGEVEFNKMVARNRFGCLFRDEEFFKAYQDGLIDTFPTDIKEKTINTYVKIGDVNQRILGVHQYSGNNIVRGQLETEARTIFIEIGNQINELYELLKEKQIQ